MPTANIGFEEKLWSMADKLRGTMDAAEYKHVVLGLLFLKYVSDACEELHEASAGEPGADPEVRDAHAAAHVIRVPEEAGWDRIREHAGSPEIGRIIDDAMRAIERENPALAGVLPKDYARPALDKTRLGEVVELFSFRVGDRESRSKDVFGRVYEYFLSRFARAEGRNGGEFYTPGCVVRLLVEMIRPFRGRVYDPCCGSGGMFVQSAKFVEEHHGRAGDIEIYGQESNPTAWRLCRMNLAIRGMRGDLGPHHADTFHRDLHPGLKADYILANPPFNISDWGGERLADDPRWAYGVPPAGNANYAWIQHIVSKLAPDGAAGFVLANGSMSTGTNAESEIRRRLVDADLVDCIVALPGRLFYSTMIPACLWFIAKNKAPEGLRDRRGEILFIDARRMGRMADRTHRVLDEEEIRRIAGTYHAWRGLPESGTYGDVKGFCKAAALDEVREHGYVLTPGRYVGVEDAEDDGEPFEDKMARLTAELAKQFAKSRELEDEIRRRLGEIGFPTNQWL